MYVIVAGDAGIGKTTVCEKVRAMADSAGYHCGGVLCPKTPDGGIDVLDVQTGKTVRLAHRSGNGETPGSGQLSFRASGVEFRREAIERGTGSDVLFVDEPGRLEAGGNGSASVPDVLPEAVNTVLVVPTEMVPAVSQHLYPPPQVYVTTAGNRDTLPVRIMLFIAVETFAEKAGRLIARWEVP